MKPFDKVDSNINILNMKPNEEESYNLNKSQDWIRDLLIELNEKMSERTQDQYLADSELDLQIRLKRVHNQPFGNVLLIKGELNLTFFTECVKTLKEMQDHLNLEFKACFVPNHFAEDDEYADLDEVFIENDVYDVHFAVNNQANLKEMIHELIYLNIDQYPSLEKDIDVAPMDAPSHTKQ